MATFELHGKSSGGVSGKLDVSSSKYESTLAMLLPNGPAWPREDATLKTLVKALTRELSRLAVRSDKLGRDLDPATTFECLEDWEASYGLPDCAQPETIAARRAAISAKLLAQTGHDQSLAFWEQLFETLGYELNNVIKGQPPMTCDDDCQDQVFDSSWSFMWTIITDSGPDDALLACVVAHNAWIGTYPVIRNPWSLADDAFLTARGLASNADGYMVAVADAGHIIRAGADQQAWDYITSYAEDLRAVCSVSGGSFIAVGVVAAGAQTSKTGLSWGFVITGATKDLYGVSRGHEDDTTAVAVGADGAMHITSDAGNSWSALPTICAQDLLGVTHCTGAMIAVGEAGRICRSTDNGASWVTIASAIASDLLAVSAWGLTVIAVGNEVWRSADAGATWTLVYSPPDTLRGVTSSPTGRWTACGSGGLIIQSLDDGITWTPQTSPTNDELYCAGAYLPSGRAIVAGDRIVLE